MPIASTEELAMLFHLLGAFLFVGGLLVAAVAFEAARRRRRPSETALLLGLARVSVVLVLLGAVVLLPFALWLVDLEHIGYGAAWVRAALVLFVVILVLGAIGGRPLKQARLLAERLGRERDEEPQELRWLLDDPKTLALNYTAAALVATILVLMIFKPG